MTVWLLYILIFIISCLTLYFSGKWVVGGLMGIARFLGWREFVVAFFVMAFSASLPNFFVGIISALQGIPELSFGDIVGGNVIDLTLAIALAVLFAKGKEISAQSRTVQTTSIFTIGAAILPLILIFDEKLSRIDAILLIGFFLFYLFWLFSKKERFTRIYNGERTSDIPVIKEFKTFLKNLGKVFLGIFLLLLAAQGIVISAQLFSKELNLSLALIGVLIIGIGNSLPEIYFSIISAKKGDTWMILGDLMGAVIVPATLVLGVVALISPIEILGPSPFMIARFFLIISSFFFFFFVKTERKITKKEALFLFGIYLAFLLSEILINKIY